MSLALSSRPHSPTAIHSGDAIFLSIHCQLTSRTALGCTPQVFRTRISPMKSGIVVSHSSLKTALVTTASSPDITGEAWFTAKVPSRLSRVLFKLKSRLINSKWQCPSMATLLSISPSASPSSGAWRTCARASSGNSARSRIITRQWRTAATSHGEGVATFSTVPLQYGANCFPSISRLTDTVGSMLSSHPRSCTNRPKLSGDLPNLQAISSKISFTDLHQVGSLSSVKFPSSTCFSQCLFERCSELHSAHSHFQQLNSGRKNHGRCIDSTCQRKRFFDTPQMTHRAAVRSPPLSFSSPALSSTATTLLSSSALSSTVTTLLSSCTFSTGYYYLLRLTNHYVDFLGRPLYCSTHCLHSAAALHLCPHTNPPRHLRPLTRTLLRCRLSPRRPSMPGHSHTCRRLSSRPPAFTPPSTRRTASTRPHAWHPSPHWRSPPGWSSPSGR